MYTILINKDLSLSTSVKSTLLRNTSTDEIWFLYAPQTASEPSGDVPEEEATNPTITVENSYTALLHYETSNVMKTETLATDEELYKERVRFVLPRSAVFFSNCGRVQLWLEIFTDTTTTTTTYDEETGEVIDETVETESSSFTTLPTLLFIDSVPHEGKCPCNKDNTIRITRGDSLKINVTLTDDNGYPYEPVEGDIILFTVKKSATAQDILIQKEIDIESLVLDLVEADTENLAFGEYKYEIEVSTVGNDHYTVIKNAPFIITEELH